MLANRKHQWLLLAMIAVANCLATATAFAFPPDFQGRFKLQAEVRWGRALLPAGEYWLRVEHSGPATIVSVGKVKSGKTIAFFPVLANEDNNSNEDSALLVGTREDRATVHSMRIKGTGVALLFDPRLAHSRRVAEAGNSESIPVIALKPSSSPSAAH
jgi:hypothetical protein